ncbi:MAG: hypothetical protein ACW98D_05010 [Promethearchaeota archaeon]|jgi:hypothetical protein
MNKREDAILQIKEDIEILLSKKNTLEVNCGRFNCEKDSCENCEVEAKLKFLEATVLTLGERIDNLLIECDTWSYTIMGNKRAVRLDGKFFDIILGYLTDEESNFYPGKLPDLLIRELIRRSYEGLVIFAKSQDSRLAYQVLGVFLMRNGATMTDEVRDLILNHSKWEEEEDQLINKKDREERKMFLLDYRERVKKYKDGVNTEVPIEILNEVMDKHEKGLFFERDPIDYKI